LLKLQTEKNTELTSLLQRILFSGNRERKREQEKQMRSRIESSYAADLRQIGDNIKGLALGSPLVRTSSGDS